MEPQSEPRHDAEVASAAAQRPEQIGVVLLVHLEKLAVGGHDLGADEVVDRQTVLADEEPDAAGQRDPAEADAPSVAQAGRQAVLAGRLGVAAGGDAGLRPRGPAVGIDLDGVHPREVENDAAVRRPEPGGAVAAAAHGELGAGLACEPDDAGDVRCRAGTHDRRRPAVEAGEEDPPRIVVAGVVGRDHGAVEAGAELGDRDVLCRRHMSSVTRYVCHLYD